MYNGTAKVTTDDTGRMTVTVELPTLVVTHHITSYNGLSHTRYNDADHDGTMRTYEGVYNYVSNIADELAVIASSGHIYAVGSLSDNLPEVHVVSVKAQVQYSGCNRVEVHIRIGRKGIGAKQRR